MLRIRPYCSDLENPVVCSINDPKKSNTLSENSDLAVSLTISEDDL